jgi:hypothetical protein
MSHLRGNGPKHGMFRIFIVPREPKEQFSSQQKLDEIQSGHIIYCLQPDLLSATSEMLMRNYRCSSSKHITTKTAHSSDLRLFHECQERATCGLESEFLIN